MMIPFFFKYIKSLEGKKPSGIFYNVLSVAPYLQLVVGIESVFSIGYENAVGILVDSYTFQGPMFPYLPDRSQMLFYACYTYMFKTLLLADFMFFSINLMKCAVSGVCNINQVMDFLFKRRKAPVKPVQYFMALLLFLIVVTALILGRDNSLDTIPLTALGSILVALFLSMVAFVGTAGTQEYQSIPGLLNAVRFGREFEDEDLGLEDVGIASDSGSDIENGIGRKTEEPAFRISDQEKEEALDKLRETIGVKLEKYVVEDQLYLKHDLTLSYVADKLGVFKDELSDYINYRYDMSFQNYINMLRITYAEKYLMSHDRVTQNEIAMECGFSGASSFNSAFSKKNGVTPKIWKDRQLELLKNQEA
ncbi:MAG: helix-turn-helix transcriptional regulator [Bacteroidaceae bacterium]|nr:helix-turn-helix transcriptional regulator [Bacteroidaceae bacterium]